MITFATHKDPARVLKNAVLDDISPVEKGTVIEYWTGQTDFEPTGRRGDVFRTAQRLHDAGRVMLFQAKAGDKYSYRAKVV